MHSLGICSGAATITLVDIEKNDNGTIINKVISKSHEGNPRDILKELLKSVNLKKFNSISATGRGFKELLNLSKIPEPLAVEHALKYTYTNTKHTKKERYNAIISAGSETFIVYKLDSTGRIIGVQTGNKCASGTGEFFIQQIKRMDVSIDEAVKYAQNEEPYNVSGRCSVFCKSDCTHATNKGIPKGRVINGLCKMIAEKILELIKDIPKKDIMIVGGVTKNKVVIDYLKKKITNLVVPKEATYFEALGASLWAMENRTVSLTDIDQLFSQKNKSQFDFLPAINRFENMVEFKYTNRGKPNKDDLCILGLDVGSTTTKAVLLRESDLKIIASEYLRTNGDPVGASRECYKSILNQLKLSAHQSQNIVNITIRGLGITGSGRKIAGVHAFTDGIINEIIAHATAALHFDSEVDTIFEIGGQDAKYTFIVNGVPSDYAMNEACSAGTGSFLEESAKETLGIEMEDIAEWAMKSNHPPNFNDQCAAFISSDVKNASNEGIPKKDITAGLVYSICMNYLNRVKGLRPIGNKIFMQGGVCYNKAVPIAMAALSGKKIIVPPEPGLMGAYGVALEVKHRLDKGLMSEKTFDLVSLANREVIYKKPFVCSGGREKCDLKCSINQLVIDGKTYPFGGACNRYYNIRHKVKINSDKYNFVDLRQRLVFKKYAPNISNLKNNIPTIGILRSFLTNTYYPMFAHFFKELGFQPILSEKIEQTGIDRCAAPLCFPCEISYGYFKNLIDLKPDYIFLPHIRGLKVENGYHPSKMCPLLQGETYFLQSSFEQELQKGPKVISTLIDFDTDVITQRKFFTSIAQQLEVSKNKARVAYDKARAIHNKMQKEMVKIGTEVIDKIEKDPDKICVVLFGRPYNAFVPEANKGIPHKFASRGINIIPDDFLDLKNFPTKEHMFWSMGQIILKAAECVKNHPQLFGVYITNFSCGPDSFLLGYFRDIMGEKPSLTLELDSHTADTGIETRIEAFLDIVERYRHLQKNKVLEEKKESKIFKPAKLTLNKGRFSLADSKCRKISIYNPRVKFIFPSMGRYSSQAIAAAIKSQGIDAIALQPTNEEILKLGRGNTTGKECLPLQLTLGSLLKYLRESQRENEVTIYFMPTTEGPCRFGQYKDFMTSFIKKNKIENVALISLSSDNAYGGISTKFLILTWCAAIISDIFDDILNAILVAAKNKDEALSKLQDIWNSILYSLEKGIKDFKKAIQQAAIDLKHIPCKSKIDKFPQVLIVGEIYVRKEDLSRRWLPERLAKHEIISHVAPIHEWIYYTNWLVQHGLSDTAKGLKERIINRIKDSIMRAIEVKIKNTIAKSGWYIPRIVNIGETIKAAENYISRKLTGEAILTVGGPITKVGKEFCGAIAIGPFACMPSRLSEALLYQKMDRYHITKVRKDRISDSVTHEIPTLPLLVIESDGNSFPQIIEAQLENFIVQALRVDKVMTKYQD